ncbi:hypothetical protein PF005_g4407 [Phytophthora fragariae]|uniref:Tyrosine-protein kinase ephrin type A/B receptor-like domain-containing protein n=1 Tax=Phytophthora fragariae TaxID=53985 RepID=A0A6A4D3R6_9STRA|nr:hypothetical protein PF009_g15667 [Phytophthora fragariae]KAE8998911.1 hypothetical protein PF011_g14846 [Phytophthora fragariae]KAE9098856.1 hypothetical protein PF010_g15404 [Phytophthora fragariae]KAE9130646.1 hypothetical protein PF007_g4440 [Phytophthora fragariae]KAE9136284.1 hypothetical protein PF006_g14422 [Phytophthora fragariae]
MDVSNEAFFRRIAVVVTASLLTSMLLLEFEQPGPLQHLRVNRPPHELIPLRLYLGVQPSPEDCPRGMYRPTGAGTAIGECEFCPRGVYGNSPGLVTKACAAPCPKGTYNDKLGAESVLDCKPCPAGVYGATTGLTNSQCSGPCPDGKYSMVEGLQSMSDCIDCPAFYRGPQGYRGNDITLANGGGYPCDRYQYGKTIVNGRDANNDAWLTGYLSDIRRPTNEAIVDNTTPW